MRQAACDFDWKDLYDLFKPAPGGMPPKLAGRGEEIGVLQDEFLRALTQKKPPPSGDAILIGPRGNGKTVLLEAFARQCEEQGLDVLRLTPGDIKTETDLAAHLLREDGWTQKLLQGLRRTSGAGLGALTVSFNVNWRSLSPAERDAYKRQNFAGLLAARCRERALVVALDEAHTLDLEVGRTLLNASQQARRAGAPFLLVLAGTPNLEARLRIMDASFWSRSMVRGIGRLKREDARKALVEPLKERGAAFDEAALAEVLDEAQGYPFFLQVWGQALCRAGAARQAGPHIDAALAAAARSEFEDRRTFYYEDRYKEIEDKGLLPMAEAIASLFPAADENRRGRTRTALKKHLCANPELALGETEAMADIEQLSHLGYLWQVPGKSVLAPGIPSLMDYVRAKGQAHENVSAPMP